MEEGGTGLRKLVLRFIRHSALAAAELGGEEDVGVREVTKFLLDYHRVWRLLRVWKGVRTSGRMIHQAGKVGAHSLPSSSQSRMP